MIIIKNCSLVYSSSICGKFMLLIIILGLWILKLHDFLKNHLFKVAHWIVKVQALESHLLSSCILELHDVLEKSFASLFILNCENSSCSWIFILLNFLKNHSLAYLMNFGFVWCFWKITHLLGSFWFMLLKIHSIVWFITFGFEWCSWESLLLGCSYWILKMPYSWKSWVNLAYEFYGGFMVLLKIILLVWINFVERISNLENHEQSIF